MTPEDMIVFFLGIALMLSMALLCGHLAGRLHFPAVLGELFGGIILGPTVLGWFLPGMYKWLFPSTGPVFYGRDALIQICMLFFLFAAGLEMNLSLFRRVGTKIAWASLMGIVFPFILGYGVVILYPGLWTEHLQGDIFLFAMFLGTALSISALPVIARILMDLNLMKTDIGIIAIGAATINDLIGWSLFAFILSNFTSKGIVNIPPYLTFILVFLLFILMLTVGRNLAQKAQSKFKSHLPWPGSFLGITSALILFAAACAEVIGIHAVFGAFLVGLAFSQNLEKRDAAHEMVYQFVMYFFAPLYFVSIGLRANFVTSFDPVLVFVVLVIACAGKILGVTLGLKLGKMPWKQATTVGIAMNARGAMEIILATVARDAGLIDDHIFVALIIMALVTSFISGPIISRLYHSNPLKNRIQPQLN
jgi:Kef-type K+ transport system membrane component KefB